MGSGSHNTALEVQAYGLEFEAPESTKKPVKVAYNNYPSIRKVETGGSKGFAV